jgi:hypothetical protein
MIGVLYLVITALIALSISYLTRYKQKVDTRPIEAIIIPNKTLEAIKDKCENIHGLWSYNGVGIIVNDYGGDEQVFVKYKTEKDPYSLKYIPYTDIKGGKKHDRKMYMGSREISYNVDNTLL